MLDTCANKENKEKRRNKEFKRKHFINDKLVCKNLFMRTFCVSYA